MQSSPSSSNDPAGDNSVPRPAPAAAADVVASSSTPSVPTATALPHQQSQSLAQQQETENSDLNSSIVIVNHPQGEQQDYASIDNDDDNNDDNNDDDDDDDVMSYNSLDSDAEREWEESKRQFELMLNFVMIPFIGKFLGRKCAYWGMFSLSCGGGRVVGVYYVCSSCLHVNFCRYIAWARFMAWKFPLEIEIANRASLVDSGDGQPAVKVHPPI